MRAYILTEEAESDLRSVIRYTRAQWNAAQARRYVSTLERGMESLAVGKVPFKDECALSSVADGAMPASLYLLSTSRGCAFPHCRDFSRTNGSDEALG